jgi:SH3-like domain-containing protein
MFRHLVLSALLMWATMSLAVAQQAKTAVAQQAETPETHPHHTHHKPAQHTVTAPQKPLRHKPAVKSDAKAPARPAEAAPVVAAPPSAAATAGAAAPAPESPKGTVTGLPLPRFAALRSDQVNLRTGPGMRYPIEWVYQRRQLPVEIEREFEVWRLVETPDGEKGWVHQATLTGSRGFIITGAEHPLYSGADEKSAPVARLMPGVIGRIVKCASGAAFCEVQTGEYRGYLARADFWGIFPKEALP